MGLGRILNPEQDNLGPDYGRANPASALRLHPERLGAERALNPEP